MVGTQSGTMRPASEFAKTCSTVTPGVVSQSLARPSGKSITASSVTTTLTGRAEVSGKSHFLTIFGLSLLICRIRKGANPALSLRYGKSDTRAISRGTFGAAHDIQSENPARDRVIAPFRCCVSGSRVHLPGLHESVRSLEARLRVWNSPVHVDRGAARRRAALPGEDGFPAMPRQLNRRPSCPPRRGLCRSQSGQR